MNSKKLKLIFLPVILLLLACKKDNTQPLLTNNPLKTEQDLLVNETVKAYAEKKTTAGLSIGILRNNEQQQYGYGEVIKGLKMIPDENTAFEIGSITKTFTAVMMLNLLSSLNLTIDEPANNLLPASIPLLIKNGKKVTIKHLLNHTSGLPRLPINFGKESDSQNPYKNQDSSKVYEALKTANLISDPGEKFEYSNLGMAVAGLIIERKSGKSYSDYLKENVCTPLGLTRTKAIRDFNENLAKGYTEKGKETPYWDLAGYAGAGSIYSTTKDLLNYSKSILNSDNSSKSAIFKKVKEVTFSSSDYKIASAWFYLTINGVECLVHDGGTGGFRSFIYIAPSKNLSIVVLANNGWDNAATVANELASRLIR